MNSPFRSSLIALIVTGLGLSGTFLSPGQARADTARDTVAENALPGTTDWRIKRSATSDELSGYANAESFMPGDSVELRVDSPGRTVAVDVYRLGYYGGAGGRLVSSIPAASGVTQPGCTLSALRMVECNDWSVTHTVDTTGWTPGIHLAKLINDAGKERYVPIILRSPSHEGTVTVVSATSTHQAYNYYGDHSLYRGPDGTTATRALAVSFNRPYHSQVHKITGYEAGPVQHMESLGVKLSYTSSFGLEKNASTFSGSAAMVFLGHDEYWSVPMRSTVEKLRDTGTNLLFLGANSAFWRIRFSADGRQVTSYKDSKLDPVKNATSTTLFRIDPFANSEAKLIGSQYICNGVDNRSLAPLVIGDPEFWAFKGTGVSKGQQFPKMVGHEIDQVAEESPANVVVAAHSPYGCSDAIVRHSDMTYYTAASGAGVVNVGTFGFSYALSVNPVAPAESVSFARAVVTNLVREAARGPLGSRFPAGAVPVDFEKNPEALYVTPGERTVNGRKWKTTCEDYSQTERCRTEIWATTVRDTGSRFVASTGWLFNNLTYLPMPAPGWGRNPLANTGSFTGTDGRQWRTECGTPATGRNGCRSYIKASVVRSSRDASGEYAYAWEKVELLNNIVRLR